MFDFSAYLKLILDYLWLSFSFLEFYLFFVRYFEALEFIEEFLDVLTDSLMLLNSDFYDNGEFLVSWLYVWLTIIFIYSDSNYFYKEF